VRDIFQGEDVQAVVVAIATVLRGIGEKVDFDFVNATFKRLNMELSKVSRMASYLFSSKVWLTLVLIGFQSCNFAFSSSTVSSINS
jgi:hypothetical protein